MVDWHLLCRRQLFRFEALGDMAPKQAHQSRRLLVKNLLAKNAQAYRSRRQRKPAKKTVEATAREGELEETPLRTPPTSLPAPGSPGAAPEAIEVNSTPQEEKQLKKQSRIRTQQLSSLAKHLDQALQYSHKTVLRKPWSAETLREQQGQVQVYLLQLQRELKRGFFGSPVLSPDFSEKEARVCAEELRQLAVEVRRTL